MKSDKEFRETQRFDHPVVLATIALVSIYILRNWMDVFYRSDLTTDQIQERWFQFAVVLVIDLLFVFVRLQTRINEKGIWLRFYPFHIRFILFPWDEIEHREVKKFKPLANFGGWGIRYGLYGTKAFTTRGNHGLFIKLKDGSKRLIGTQKIDDVNAALTYYNFKAKD